MVDKVENGSNGGRIRLVRAFLWTALCALVLIGLPVEGFAKPEAAGVRIADHAGKTRFVVDLTEKVSFSIFTLPDPYRVVIDLPEVAWHAPMMGRPKDSKLIKSYRFGLFAAGHSRIVLDMGKPVRIGKAFLLAPTGKSGWRFVLDVNEISRQTFLANRKRIDSGFKAPVQQASVPPVPPKKSVAPRRGQIRKPVVVIDAGHGGVDPGATGVSGMYEKHITLAMARQLRDALNAKGKFRVVLTRDRDIFIPLRKRVAIARAAGGDLFMSIHADAMTNRKTRGLSVYTLSEKASDKEAGLLAERENKVDLIAGMDLSNETREVTDILIDLAQRETMNLSARYAAFAVGELRREVRLLRRTHRFASFAVLKAPDIPSVLLEIGYLSHPEEERLLRKKTYRAKLARAMVKSVELFFAKTQKARLP